MCCIYSSVYVSVLVSWFIPSLRSFCRLSSKESTCNAGDTGSIPQSGGSPGEGNGNPLQYSCLENPMDGGAWWAAAHGVTTSQTRLSDFTFTHWRRKWQPTPVFLPGESQGRGNLVGCRLWSHTKSDTTEATEQPVFLPGKPHGQKGLASYSPWGHKKLDQTKQLNTPVLKGY